MIDQLSVFGLAFVECRRVTLSYLGKPEFKLVLFCYRVHYNVQSCLTLRSITLESRRFRPDLLISYSVKRIILVHHIAQNFRRRDWRLGQLALHHPRWIFDTSHS